MTPDDEIEVYFIYDEGCYWFGTVSDKDVRKLGGGSRYAIIQLKLHKSHVGLCTYYNSNPEYRDKLIVMCDCKHSCNCWGNHDFTCSECGHYKPLGKQGDNAIKRI